MGLLWFILAIIFTGLTMAYTNAKIKSKDGFLDLEEEDKSTQIFFTTIISLITGLLWFIVIPVWLVYKLGKKIFK